MESHEILRKNLLSFQKPQRLGRRNYAYCSQQYIFIKALLTVSIQTAVNWPRL